MAISESAIQFHECFFANNKGSIFLWVLKLPRACTTYYGHHAAKPDDKQQRVAYASIGAEEAQQYPAAALATPLH